MRREELTDMRDLEDSNSPTIGLDALQALLQLDLFVSLPLLDWRSIGEIIPSLVDLETMVLEVVVELIEKERRSDVAALVAAFVRACEGEGVSSAQERKRDNLQSRTTAE